MACEGNVLYRLKRYAEAASAYSAALDHDPAPAWVWAMNGHALYWLHRYTEALAAYEQAIAREPDNRTYWEAKARTLWRCWRFREIWKAAARLLELREAQQAQPNSSASTQAHEEGVRTSRS
jgi:tetratricopeptide (TPR) repeat protein